MCERWSHPHNIKKKKMANPTLFPPLPTRCPPEPHQPGMPQSQWHAASPPASFIHTQQIAGEVCIFLLPTGLSDHRRLPGMLQSRLVGCFHCHHLQPATAAASRGAVAPPTTGAARQRRPAASACQGTAEGWGEAAAARRCDVRLGRAAAHPDARQRCSLHRALSEAGSLLRVACSVVQGPS